MKNKKLFSLFAVGLALSLFSGCAPANKVNFRNYWDSNSLSNVAEDIRETLEYDVTFVKATPTVDYEISYSNGKYKTELTYENGQYTYTTSLSIEVTYTLNGETTATLQDSVLTNVVFTTAENGLYPVSSSKTIVSHSPVGSKQTQADKCYKLHDYQVTTNYTN
ncbi:MAG: hypothetical protein J6A46_00365 [Clostridia bacterium]|nr:hypothetical protein [Clostridia bacterium]